MSLIFFFLFLIYTATTDIYTLSLHDALPIFERLPGPQDRAHGQLLHPHRRALDHDLPRLGPDVDSREQHRPDHWVGQRLGRSEEHTSELQSRFDLVCRLLLEKKKY